MKKQELLKIARDTVSDPMGNLDVLRSMPGDPGKFGTYAYWGNRLATWIQGNAPIPCRIFAEKGNSKLPFYAFSSLPAVDCPGAGDCLNWCYSFKAWRHPVAWARQLQNSILIRSEAGRRAISEAWHAIPEGKTVRLYVDGDFPNVEILRFWMDACHARPDLQAYGYSKSWQVFLRLAGTGYVWPSNYILNLSSGSKHGPAIKAKIDRLSVARGEFIAVPVDKRHIANKAYRDKGNDGSREYRRDVSVAMHHIVDGKRVFPCPGNCSNCLPGGRHACGTHEFRSVCIGIGVHG